jgi:glutamate--cysteine ligase
VPKQALATPFRSRTVRDVAREVVAIAKSGLAARARIDWDGQDETRYLARLEQIAADGRTPAEEKLERFHAAWEEKVDPVFMEYAF